MPRVLTAALLSWFVLAGAQTPAQDSADPALAVTWKHSATFPWPGVTRVAVFDDSICRVELLPDQIRLTGLARGTTIMIVWAGEQRRSVIVRVRELEEKRPPSLLARRRDATSIAGFFQASAAQNKAPFLRTSNTLSNRMLWQESLNSGILAIYSDTLASVPGRPDRFNLTTAAVEYASAHAKWTLLDSNLTLGNSPASSSNALTSVSSLVFRGFQYSRKSNSVRYTAFVGTTLPVYMFRLAGTSDLAGARIDYQANPRLSFFFTQALTGTSGAAYQNGLDARQRRWSAMQLTGLSARLNAAATLNVSGGFSNRGLLADADLRIQSVRDAVWISGRYAAMAFPLNQLHLLSSGRLSASAGAQKTVSDRLDLSATLQHTSFGSTPAARLAGGSDYGQVSVAALLSPGHRISASVIQTRSTNLLNGREAAITGRRLTLDLFTRLGERASNSFRIAKGALRDPFQYNSQSELSLRETVQVRLGSAASVSLQLSRDRINPSLVARLSQNVAALAPGLEQAFAQDPVAFVNSPEMSPSLRALLTSLQPGNLQGTLETQLRMGKRVDLSLSLGQYLEREISARHSRNRLYGFNFHWRLTSGLDLVSSMSETWMYTAGDLRRTRVVTLGLNKRLDRSGRGVRDFFVARHSISGRVFRDSNGSGTWNAGEAPFPGMRIFLSNGQTAVTDEEGRFRFAGLHPYVYTVTLPLGQFGKPVRVTTPVERTVELSEVRTMAVEFGIIDHSRIRGTAFNDYLMTGIRQPDAPSVEKVRLRLRNTTAEYEAESSREGDFEFEGIPPGDYQLTVDRASMPDEFEPVLPPGMVRVASAQTTTVDLPFRALRSVSGRILFRDPARSTRRPLAGVRVTAGGASGITGPNGEFLLRGLPAGEVLLSLVPRLPVPAGKAAPSGIIRLGRNPFAGSGMEIVISDPDLALCLSSVAPDEWFVPPPFNVLSGTSGSGNEQ